MFLTYEQVLAKIEEQEIQAEIVKQRNLANWYRKNGISPYSPPKPRKRTVYFSGTEKEYELGCRRPEEDPRYCPVCSIQYNRDMCDAGQCDMPCGRC